ncbi:plasmid pRiA4b ORF-3 family protein [Candidatus Protofrankia californiensis]|uniref:plasmid pRiA4b ORF-3 family protein n=1 Tax=Candidatus Protofrankia californiensis TaxID=1839754 RepID=UPI0013EBF730|nr:plasmid pRiA4b ORF-3 family protein [Candidatus Protofrankia californiensis]
MVRAHLLVSASATLGDLHDIIRVVLGWGDDHLHAFTADGARYANPYYKLDDCGDEDAVRLSRVLPREGAALTYVYDFGDWWEHTITLEKIVDAEAAAVYPTCLTGCGDAPVEDWNPEYPEEPTPFDRDDINRDLAALAGAASSS